MVDRESLYLKLPAPLQKVICNLQGWNINRTRYSAVFQQKLADASYRTFWSTSQIAEFRNRRLREYVHHCATTVPFYRQQFRELHIHPDDIQTIDDLKKLPVLTKRQVQENYTGFLSEAVRSGARIIAHTSGTTGGGLRFATMKEAVQEQWAVWWRYRMWHGLALDTWCGYFGGRSIVPIAQNRPPFWRYNIPGKQLMFSIYHLAPQNIDYYVNELRKKKLLWFHGYPSALCLLASYMLEKGLDLGYRVRWVTTGAENLLENQASMIHMAFGVKPIQHYGMAEAVANISECEQGHLHVDEDFAAVEFDFDETTGTHKVVGTNLSNYATPLLRYDTQDFVTPRASGCSCGRPGRTISQIDGRQEDFIVLRNGARIGRMDHIFKDLVRIREAQIYQERPGALVVRVVKGNGYSSEDERALRVELRKRVGADCEIEVTYCNEIERSKTGKLRLVVAKPQLGNNPPI